MVRKSEKGAYQSSLRSVAGSFMTLTVYVLRPQNENAVHKVSNTLKRLQLKSTGILASYVQNESHEGFQPQSILFTTKHIVIGLQDGGAVESIWHLGYQHSVQVMHNGPIPHSTTCDRLNERSENIREGGWSRFHCDRRADLGWSW